ncbi:hypothetical protein CC86DRAFT_404143 [Ophiobolus disseminans]|uniref:Uncharacterized protein n=1 Tax=Ophiobolus disseminans TaxID=1469910 RepID=A0A6A7AA62_9PLEO|nr:hypothetical protein CC86DRAFT_404143 [Ophiobolus disseminans]
MPGHPSYASTHWGPKLRGLFEKYWDADPAFSPFKLDEYRQGWLKVQSIYPSSQSYADPLIEDNFPSDPAAVIHNEIHPLFQPANFITNLPLGEVRDVLQPAFQLASCFISDDRALEWFVHVRYATMLPVQAGPGILIRRAGPITSHMLGSVKKGLLGLAGRVPITFASRILVDKKGHDASAAACHNFYQILRILKAPRSEYLKNSAVCNNYRRSMIVLRLDFFYQALQHHHCATTPAQKRCFQFFLAILLLHELAHTWLGICHPSIKTKGDAIVHATDCFPEAGFSWEKFMFDARIFGSPFRLLAANTFQSEFCAPRHKMSVYIPVSWVNQWFLRETWQNFAKLHSDGKLYAPSADRQVDNFITCRYCATFGEVFSHDYVGGMLVSKPCCHSKSCGGLEPGTTKRWPEDPVQFRALLLKLIDEDIAVAKRRDQDITKAIRNLASSKDHYDKIVRRMNRAEVPRAKGLVLKKEKGSSVPVPLVQQKASSMLDRVQNWGRYVVGCAPGPDVWDFDH